MSILGNRVLRVEDPRLLTEGGTYCADLRDTRLDGAVHATFVRSTAAHADVLAVDTTVARGLPGVVGVVTGADVDLAPIPGWFAPAMARPFLAAERVRFVGEPVAVVLTERADQGEDAAEAVAVDYRPLPVLIDPERAAGGDVLLFPDVGTNQASEFGRAPGGEDGDPFAACEVVVHQRVVNQRLAGAPLEVRSAAAAWADDRLHLWCSTQNVHGVRDALVGTYGLDAAEVVVVTPDVGGGFGPKIGVHPEELLLPWLARRCGRPVRWVESRSENLMAMAQGRAQVQQVSIGGRRDGTIEAYRLSIVQDVGAFPAMGAYLPDLTCTMAAGTYAIADVAAHARTVVTNTPSITAYRGAGRPEATAAIERAVDLFAAEVGVDPVDVRRRNLLTRFDDPHTTPTGATYDCGDFPAAFERLLAAADYPGLRAEQRRRRERGDVVQLGIGVSSYVEVTAGPTAGGEYARVEVLPAGDVVVHTGTSPHGQGHATAFAMLVADELGVALERVRVLHGDTDAVPRGVGTFGSRSLQLGGAAVHGAAVELVERARHVAAELLEASADDVVLDRDAGAFHVAGTPARSCAWAEVAAAAPESAAGSAAGSGDGSADGGLRVEHDFQAAQPTFPFGAHVAVVEVDTETGDARLVRFVACDDAGRILNPVLAEGQRHGGIAQGVAQALYEQVAFDADGNPLTATLADYLVVSAAELPSFELVDLETPTWVNPLGAKGIGESGTVGSTPAVQNAVCDALAHLGVRHVDMPCTPERVWRAIASARAE
jgi:carbon-monoxide dehydrogenase large subunit